MGSLEALPTWLIAVGLLLLMFVGNEAGFRLAVSQKTEDEESRSVSGALKASIFALVAFLLGFAFSMTSSRHDVRRRLVLDEANAVGTLYLRAGVVEAQAGEQIRRLLREYVEARLQYFTNNTDLAATRKTEAKMQDLLDKLWSIVEQLAKSDPTLVRTSLLLPAANEVIDLSTTRQWAVGSHLPAPVAFLLIFGVVVSSILAGHSSGQSRNRHIGLWASFNVLFVMVLYIVLDFDRPGRGLVQVNHSPLVELQKSMAVGE